MLDYDNSLKHIGTLANQAAQKYSYSQPSHVGHTINLTVAYCSVFSEYFAKTQGFTEDVLAHYLHIAIEQDADCIDYAHLDLNENHTPFLNHIDQYASVDLRNTIHDLKNREDLFFAIHSLFFGQNKDFISLSPLYAATSGLIELWNKMNDIVSEYPFSEGTDLTLKNKFLRDLNVKNLLHTAHDNIHVKEFLNHDKNAVLFADAFISNYISNAPNYMNEEISKILVSSKFLRAEQLQQFEKRNAELKHLILTHPQAYVQKIYQHHAQKWVDNASVYLAAANEGFAKQFQNNATPSQEHEQDVVAVQSSLRQKIEQQRDTEITPSSLNVK